MLESVLAPGASIFSLALCMLAALLLGALVSLVYTRRAHHSAGFAMTLALLPMTVAVIIMLVNGNIGAGIAVAGSFALVRFRSVPGTAREISGVFTATAMGLALGMGYIGVAALLCAATCAAVLCLEAVHFGENVREKQLRVLVPEDVDYNTIFTDVFEKHGVKAECAGVRTTNMGTLIELTYYVTLPDGTVPKAFLDDLRVRNGNLNVTFSPAQSRKMM